MIDLNLLGTYFAQGCSDIAELFVKKTLYNDIIENQDKYFREENSFIYNGQEGLSIKNFSTRVFLLWIQHVEEDPLNKTLILSLYQALNSIVEISYVEILAMTLLSVTETVFYIKFRIPEGDIVIPLKIDIDFEKVISEINSVINQYEE